MKKLFFLIVLFTSFTGFCQKQTLGLKEDLFPGTMKKSTSAQPIVISSKIPALADITLVSEKFILLDTGFFTEQGSFFSATVDENQQIGIYNPIVKPIFYPNPANSKVTIIAEKNITSVSLTSYEGMPIFNQISEAGKSFELNIENYSKGIYFLSVETDDGKTTIQKLIHD